MSHNLKSEFSGDDGFARDRETLKVLLRLNEVLEVVPAGRSTLYEWISKGLFPAPIRIGPRRVVWRQSDIVRFISDKSQEIR